ncbi:PspC domain-containing protein [Nonomuraea mesophila]|nr:PspC domain-containing protein [Nonomuraea mesophila]
MTEAPPREPAAPHRVLRRSSEGRFLMGVCAGLGRHTGIDPVVFRVGFAVLMFGSGIGLFLYLSAFLLMKEPNGKPGLIEQWTGRDFDADTVMALMAAVLACGLGLNLATVWLDVGTLVVGVFLAVSLLAAHASGVDLLGLARSMPERLSRCRTDGGRQAPSYTTPRTTPPVGPQSARTGLGETAQPSSPSQETPVPGPAGSGPAGSATPEQVQGQRAAGPPLQDPSGDPAPGTTHHPSQGPAQDTTRHPSHEAAQETTRLPGRDPVQETTGHPVPEAVPGTTSQPPVSEPTREFTRPVSENPQEPAAAGTDRAHDAGGPDPALGDPALGDPAPGDAVTAEHAVPPYQPSEPSEPYKPSKPYQPSEQYQQSEPYGTGAGGPRRSQTTPSGHSGYGDPFAPHGPYQPLDPARRGGYSPYDPALYTRPAPVQAPPRRRRPRSFIGVLTVLLAFIIGGIVMAAQARTAAGVSPTIVGGAMLITIGAGLLIAAWWGRGAGLVAAGTFVTLLVGTGLMLGGVPSNVGSSEWVPRSVAEASRHFDAGLGDGRLDLSELTLEPGSTTTFTASVKAGELVVIVPPTARVEVRASSKVGDITLDQSVQSGVDVRVREVLPPEVRPKGEPATVVLELRSGLGDIEVRRAA